MSTATVKQKLSTASATQQAAFLLELPDVKRLGVALAEAAADEIAKNDAFAQKVRTLYEALAMDSSPKTTSKSKKVTKASPLVPINPVEPGSIDVSLAKPLDPYWLNDVFGSHQLREALDGYSVPKLKEGAAMVEQRTGSKPANKTRKATLIDYIVEHVTASASV